MNRNPNRLKRGSRSGHVLHGKKLVLRTLLTQNTVSFCLLVTESSLNASSPCTQQFSGRWSTSESTATGIPTTRGYPRTGMLVLVAGRVCASTAEASTITTLETSDNAAIVGCSCGPEQHHLDFSATTSDCHQPQDTVPSRLYVE
jgi:hypothetical protein